MAYGINVYRSDGDLQLNSVDPIFTLKEEKTATLTGSVSGYRDPISIISTNGPPVIAWKALSKPYCFWGFIRNSEGEYTEAEFLKEDDGLNASASFAIFVKPNQISDQGTYGIRVYNSNGDVVYREDLKPLEIVGIYTGTHSSSLGTTKDVNVQDADNNYFILSPHCNIAWYSPDTSTLLARMFTKVDSNTIRLISQEVTTYSVTKSGEETWTDSYKLIEVKG